MNSFGTFFRMRSHHRFITSSSKQCHEKLQYSFTSSNFTGFRHTYHTVEKPTLLLLSLLHVKRLHVCITRCKRLHVSLKFPLYLQLNYQRLYNTRSPMQDRRSFPLHTPGHLSGPIVSTNMFLSSTRRHVFVLASRWRVPPSVGGTNLGS